MSRISSGAAVLAVTSTSTSVVLTLLDKAGVHPEKIGDRNGRLDHVSDL
jgi:hypothetical protein